MRPLVFAAAVLISACGGSSGGNKNPNSPTSPPPQNQAPSVTATAVPAFGIDSLTQFTFRAQGSDPDGDALTYRWTLSDGSSAEGTGVVRTYVGGGTVQATVTATDGTMSTSAQTSITVGSLTGTWRMNPTLYPGWLIDFKLTQTGATVTGTTTDNLYGPGKLDPAVVNTIDAQGRIVFRIKQDPFGDIYARGRMDNTGRRITGTLEGRALTVTEQPFVMDKI